MAMTLHIYRPRPFQWTWFGVKQPHGCCVLVSTRFQGPLLCPWACPLCPHWQMIMALHINRPRQFQWTWFGAIWPSGYQVTASTKFGMEKWMNRWTDGWIDGQTDKQMDGEHSIVSLSSFGKGGGQKKNLINIIVLLKTNIAGFSPNHPLNGSYE